MDGALSLGGVQPLRVFLAQAFYSFQNLSPYRLLTLGQVGKTFAGFLPEFLIVLIVCFKDVLQILFGLWVKLRGKKC